jgi:hypothetical protein
MLSNTPDPHPTDCVIPECEAPPVPDAPLPVCLGHIRDAFAYYLRHADDLPHSTGRDAYEIDRTNGWIYFARFGDIIKIGWSRTPVRRFGQLQPDAVMHYQPGTREQEQQLHAAFAHLLDHGREWFRAEPDLIAFIGHLHSGAA